MPTTPKPINIGSNRVLLFDDAFTDTKRGFKLTMNPALRDPQPVILPDQSWEKVGIFGDSMCSVIDDDGLIRIWYSVPHPATADQVRAPLLAPAELKGFDAKTLNDIQSQARFLLCYAESDDGVNFRKPHLNVIRFGRSGRNNMVFAGRLGGTIFKDPSAKPSARYKIVHGHGPRLPNIHRGSDLPAKNIYHAIYSSHSPDGWHWKTTAKPSINWYTDTTNVAYYDDEKRRYVAFVRMNEGMTFNNGRTIVQPGGWKWRAIGRTESKDFTCFPKPKKIAEPSKREALPRATGMDYYNSAALKYPFAPSSYLMFSSNYYHDTHMLDVHLATSRDGITYARHDQPFLGVGRDGEFDCKRTYMATGIVRRDDELWMYYLGQSTDHDRSKPKPLGVGGIGRVRLRLDGFASQDAPHSGGSLTTKPLRFSGKTLTVNMDASAGGHLKVELQTPDGKPIPGYTAKDADLLIGNSTSATVTWRGSSKLPAVNRKAIRIRFTGKAVKLYAFGFAG